MAQSGQKGTAKQTRLPADLVPVCAGPLVIECRGGPRALPFTVPQKSVIPSGTKVKSRDLRTNERFHVKSVRRSFDSLRSLRMTCTKDCHTILTLRHRCVSANSHLGNAPEGAAPHPPLKRHLLLKEKALGATPLPPHIPCNILPFPPGPEVRGARHFLHKSKQIMYNMLN